MSKKSLKLLAVAALCLYAIAGVHQLLPHDGRHGAGESCALCVLFLTPLVWVPAIVLIFVRARTVLVSPPLPIPVRPDNGRTVSLRGPPSRPF